MKSLYEFQKTALKNINQHDRALLALDMGLGKTFVGLNWLQEKLPTNWLIITPPNKTKDWEQESREFLKNYNIIRIEKSKDFCKLDLKNLKETILIMSYNMFVLISKKESLWFQHLGLGLGLLLDESQALKNHKSERSKEIWKLHPFLKYVLLLSGDPISKRYENLFMQMKMLELFSINYTFNNFVNDYCKTQNLNGTSVQLIVGYKNLDHLIEKLHTKSYFLKTNKAYDLPETNEIIIKLKKSKEYDLIKDEKVFINREKNLIAFQNTLSLMLALRQVCSGFVYDQDVVYNINNNKIEALEAILEASQNNVVVFYNFKAECDMIKKLALKLNKKVLEINGNNNCLDDRVKFSRNFKDKKSIDDNVVLLAQYLSGAAGIDGLQNNFCYTIYYSLTLSGEDYKQSLKRTHRINQSNKCIYYVFITENTIEENIYKSLKKSENYTKTLFKQEFNIKED